MTQLLGGEPTPEPLLPDLEDAKRPLARVLVVEDHPLLAKLLRSTLSRALIATTVAGTGEQALTLLAREKYDLILLDIALPGIGGLEVCRQLRANEKLKHLPVVFTSGQGTQANKAEAQRLGAVDFFEKPLNMLPLLARIIGHLQLRTNGRHNLLNLPPAQ